MHLTIDELLAYTDEERAKWEAWFQAQGDEPLKLAVPMDVHPTVGALILHCFWAELFYAHWMLDDV
jgi:LPS sulfotransferase NodH